MLIKVFSYLVFLLLLLGSIGTANAEQCESFSSEYASENIFQIPKNSTVGNSQIYLRMKAESGIKIKIGDVTRSADFQMYGWDSTDNVYFPLGLKEGKNTFQYTITNSNGCEVTDEYVLHYVEDNASCPFDFTSPPSYNPENEVIRFENPHLDKRAIRKISNKDSSREHGPFELKSGIGITPRGGGFHDVVVSFYDTEGKSLGGDCSFNVDVPIFKHEKVVCENDETHMLVSIDKPWMQYKYSYSPTIIDDTVWYQYNSKLYRLDINTGIKKHILGSDQQVKSITKDRITNEIYILYYQHTSGELSVGKYDAITESVKIQFSSIILEEWPRDLYVSGGSIYVHTIKNNIYMIEDAKLIVSFNGQDPSDKRFIRMPKMVNHNSDQFIVHAKKDTILIHKLNDQKLELLFSGKYKDFRYAIDVISVDDLLYVLADTKDDGAVLFEIDIKENKMGIFEVSGISGKAYVGRKKSLVYDKIKGSIYILTTNDINPKFTMNLHEFNIEKGILLPYTNSLNKFFTQNNTIGILKNGELIVVYEYDKKMFVDSIKCRDMSGINSEPIIEKPNVLPPIEIPEKTGESKESIVLRYFLEEKQKESLRLSEQEYMFLAHLQKILKENSNMENTNLLQKLSLAIMRSPNYQWQKSGITKSKIMYILNRLLNL